MPSTLQKFNAFSENIAEGAHNLQSHTLKALLTNTAPVAANSIKADIIEISAANGYTAGGVTVPVASSAQVSGTYKLVLTDSVFTASGGTIGPFRYAVIYNDTQTSPAKPLIGWLDYGASISLLDGETLTLDFDPTAGILTLA